MNIKETVIILGSIIMFSVGVSYLLEGKVIEGLLALIIVHLQINSL